jgi:hypothetical protein
MVTSIPSLSLLTFFLFVSPPHYTRTERREVTSKLVMVVLESTEAILVDEEMLVVNITTESFSISSTLVTSERSDYYCSILPEITRWV